MRVFAAAGICIWKIAGAVAFALLLSLVPAVAADDDQAALEAKKKALFQQMLANPANLDVAFAYADVAAKLGDNEGAVSTLERMLLFNPNLPRVKLELGALYYRMGSFELARSYFGQAKAANAPAEVQARVDEYLGKISSSEAPQQLTGYFFVGAQYQSDANVAPGSPLIHSPIGDVLLSSQFVKSHDINIFATGAVYYSYDLGTQDRDTIEAGFTGFANHYFRFGRLDLDLGELTAGPRLRYPNPDLPFIVSASLKPYVIANEVGLGENQYFDTYGAGLEGTALLFGDLSAKMSFEFREKNFTDAPDRPLSRGLNGNDSLVTVALSKPVTPNSAVALEFDFLNQKTRLDFYTNKAYSVAGSYHITYDDPVKLLRYPWETTVFLSRVWDNYAAPDPCCNTSGNPFVFSGSDRYDRHWRFGLTQAFQFAPNMALVVQVQRDVVSSDLPIYAYTSNSVLVGPQIRF
jgi:tetratricopeptide (TPR) repeat protein